MRIGHLRDGTETNLSAALSARDVDVALVPRPEPTASEPPTGRGLFRRKSAAPVHDPITETVEWADAHGVAHLRVGPIPEDVRTAKSIAEAGGPSFSILGMGPATVLSAEDWRAASFVTHPTYRHRAAVLAANSSLNPERHHVIPTAVDQNRLPEPLSWRAAVSTADGVTGHIVVLPGEGAGLGLRLTLTALKAMAVRRTVVVADAALGEATKLARLAGIAADVTILPRSDGAGVIEAIATATAAVCPALVTPPIAPILEAMALGRPVIAPMVGDVPELLDITCGWLVRPGHAEDMAASLRDALTADPRKGSAMSAEALRRIRTVHSAGKAADALLALIASTGR